MKTTRWSVRLAVAALVFVLGFVCYVSLARGQASGSLIPAPGVINSIWQTVPGAVPTSATDLCAQTFYATEIVLTNTNSGTGTTTVTATSKTGVLLFTAAIPGTGGSNNYVIAYPQGLQFPGGVTWQATGTGVNGYVKGGF